MTASDVPESWTNAEAMARVLLTYMPDNKAVQQAVSSHFGRAYGLSEIRRLRAAHERRRKRSENEYSTTAAPLDFRDPSISAQRKADKRFLNALYLTYPERKPK